METVRQLNACAARKFKEAAKAIPAAVVDQLEARAFEAVESGEPHKCTGGWIASPFYGSCDILGLLEVASKALRTEQARAFNSIEIS